MDETVRIVEYSNVSDKCETIGEIAKNLVCTVMDYWPMLAMTLIPSLKIKERICK